MITSKITPRLQEILVRAMVRDYDYDNCPQYVSVHQDLSGSQIEIYSSISISGLTWAKDSSNNYFVVFNIAIPYAENFNGSNCVVKLHSKKNEVLAETNPFEMTIQQGQTYIATWKINVFGISPITSI